MDLPDSKVPTFTKKVVYYAEPKDPFQKPKNKPDKESLEAAYLTLEEILNLKSVWRGP
jgi:hypothetical protein